MNGTWSGQGRISRFPGGGFFAPVCARGVAAGRAAAAVAAAAAADSAFCANDSAFRVLSSSSSSLISFSVWGQEACQRTHFCTSSSHTICAPFLSMPAA